jgi:hypothetical protein
MTSQEREKRKELIRLYGTSHINFYAHSECSNALLLQIESQGKTIDPEKTFEYSPEQLISVYADITHCDACNIEFKMSDKGFVSYSALDPDELALWREIQAEVVK